jgi:hypothetical protein
MSQRAGIQDLISLSKSLCPACWELLDILRGNRKEFNVRGCHTTVSPVELPAWLPNEVLHKVLARFRKHLHTKMLEASTGKSYSTNQ